MKSREKLSSWFFWIASAALFSCSQEDEPSARRFELHLRASSERGEALPGVRFVSGDDELGITGERGKISVRLRGREGSRLPLTVACPEGHEAHAPLDIRLATTRSLTKDTPLPLEVEVVCERSLRDVVVVVHAPGGENLPVEIDGRREGVTDGEGTAHIALSLPRKSAPLEVRLDTEANERLRPRNPTRIFDLGERDAVLLFEQSFSAAAARPKGRPRAASRPRFVPVRIE